MSKKDKLKKYLKSPYAMRKRVLMEVAKYANKIFNILYNIIDAVFGLVAISIYIFKKKKSSTSNVLVCRYKYYDYHELNPTSYCIEKITMDQSLDEYIKDNPEKNIKYDVFFWDEGLILCSTFQLFKKILCGGYGVVQFSAYSPEGAISQPGYFVMRILRLVANFKLICSEPDAPLSFKRFKKKVKLTDYIYVWVDKFRDAADSPYAKKIKYFVEHHPVWLSSFSVPQQKRKYDVAFIGMVNGSRPSYKYRAESMSRLKKSGFNVFYSGGSGDYPLSNEEMFRVYGNSKIVISFARGVDRDFPELKGRPLEAAGTGALILEESGSQLYKVYEKGVHYDVFDSSEMLIEKIRYYLNNEQMRVKMAQAAHDRWLNNFTGIQWWGDVFNLLNDDKHVSHIEKIMALEAKKSKETQQVHDLEAT